MVKRTRKKRDRSATLDEFEYELGTGFGLPARYYIIRHELAAVRHIIRNPSTRVEGLDRLAGIEKRYSDEIQNIRDFRNAVAILHEEATAN